MITLALPKGRLADESIDLLIKKKWFSKTIDESSRELSFQDDFKRLKILMVKPLDVATYVEEGAADAGIIGLDTLQEGKFDLLNTLDLKIGHCRLSLASKKNFNLKDYKRKIKVATKYPNLTKEFFFSKGINCEIIKLYGSIELAPLCGLSDCIVDLVSTGATLKANGLEEIEIILESTARLVFNRNSLYRIRKESLQLISDLENP
jgi:ATP phosphoribosyltransferase